MLRLDLQESIQFPDHYHVPEMETILISKAGVVIEMLAMFCPLVKHNPENNDSYPHVNLPGSDTQAIHRLLALTFLSCPGNPDEYHVNHIDGIKTNHALDNLEWVTPSGNSIHAYETGLRTDNRPVLIKDLRTDIESRCYSLNEVARQFGCNVNKVYLYLNSETITPFEVFYTLTYEGVGWKPLSKADIGKPKPGRARPVVAVWKSGTRIDIFESATHAAIELEMSHQSVVHYASGSNNVRGKGFFLYYATDFTGDLKDAVNIPDSRKKVAPKPPKRLPEPITVKDTTTGAVEWWESVEAFTRSLGVKKNTVQKSMLLKSGRWKHYQIEYCVKEPNCPSEQ